MKTSQCNIVRLGLSRRIILVLLFVTVLPRFAPAASDYLLRIDSVVKGESPDSNPNDKIELVSFEWGAKRNETHTLQFSPDLVQPFVVIDSFTLAADGTIFDTYVLPPNTLKGFFRLGLPQVQINSIQPFTILSTGGTFFLLGQVFAPSYSVRIDGNPVAASFIDGSTFQVNVGALAQGFHTVTIVDAGNNVVATLSNGLFVNTTGRTDQESPPQAPEVNNGAGISDAVDAFPCDASASTACYAPADGQHASVVFEDQWPSDGDLDFNDVIVAYNYLYRSPSPSFVNSIGLPFALTFPTLVPYPNEAGLNLIGPVTVTSWAKADPSNGIFQTIVGKGDTSYRLDMDWNGYPRFADGQANLDVPIDLSPLSLEPVKLEPLFAVPRVNEATGELFVEYVDLRIPGRGGLDVVWGRTYRSIIGLDTAMGVGWDFSYNLRVQLSGSNVTVQDGQNRIDTYFLQPDGSFSTDELFRRGTLTGQVFTLQFANNTNWVFKPLDGSPTSGKIDKIIDRNSNQLQFFYNGTGQLVQIIDSLGRPFQIVYDAAGRIQFVQDFAGRQLVYTHHNGTGPGGSLGDLLAVRSQVVTGTPTGNDFPGGKTAQFTYTSGFPDPARNHDMLSARDGLNQTWLQVSYAPTAVTTDLLYDRVASEIIGMAGETRVFTYLAQAPTVANRFGTTKTIVNDAVGNVHESLYDSKNRLLDLRQYTGRSTPGVPVTESTNRPTGQLRAGDPAFFKTTIDWNRDSLATRVTWPRGNGLEMVYHRDFDPATNPRFRANLRVERELPVSGAPLVTRFDYQAGFGTCEVGMSMSLSLSRWINGAFDRANTRSHGSGTPGMGSTTGRAAREFQQALISEIALPKLDGASRDAAYMTLKLPPELPRAKTSSKTWLPANFRFEIGGLPCPRVNKIDSFNFKTSCVDARGNTWTYTRDANGNLTHAQSPDPVTASDLEYNLNGQLTAIVLPPNASAHRERDEFHYYTSGPQTGYLQTFIRDAGGLNLTTGFTHDLVGNITQIVDPRGKDTQFFVNQLNQVVQITSRDVGGGIRYLTNIYRDANNRITIIDVQNKDEFGAVGANAFFTTSFLYDSLDHMTSMTREVDSGHTVTTQYFYNAIRDLIEVRSPLAVTAVQPDARVQYAYDERNLPFTAVAGPSTPIATGSTYTYDLNGNLTKTERGAPAGTQHVATATYDGFDRLSSLTSPVNTQTTFSYNANHQPTQRTVAGSFLDGAGNPTVGTLASRSWTYGSTGVCTRMVDSFFDIITQLPISDGARTTTYSYDPALNLTGITDDNGHTTSCSYDGANRLSRMTDPKGETMDSIYDANSNVVARTRTDKSDTAAPDQAFTETYVYDGLDRPITSTDNIGNARSYMYDSRSNRVRYLDPRSNLTQYEYDGLNRPTRVGRDMNANSSGFDAGTDIVTGYAWDDNSRLVGRTDPNTHATQYLYDSLGRTTQRTNADGTSKTWSSYNPWGRAGSSQDENGTVITYAYDNDNRLKQRNISIPMGSAVSSATTFELFDYPGDYGWSERAINDAAVVRYTHDSLGRLTSERLGNRITNYTHDAVGNLLTLQSPGGRTTTYTYDAANLCTGLSLTVTSDGDSLGSIATYKYIGARLESVTHRNGTVTSYTYDGFVGAPVSSDLGWGKVTSALTLGPGSSVLDQRTYTYDGAQNLSERHDTRAGSPGLLHHYDYDAADRNVHTQVTAPGPAIVRDTTYNYDRNGNRISVNGPGTPNPGSYTQNPGADAQMNQYSSTPLGSYSYDANGDRIGLTSVSGNRGYKYDYAKRLVELTGATPTPRLATYQYDAFGRRIQKILDPDGTPNETDFIYTGESVLEERNSGGAVMAAYTPFNSAWLCPADRANSGLLSASPEESRTFNMTGGVITNVGSSGPIEMRRAGNDFTCHMENEPWLFCVSDSSGAAVERYEYEDFRDPHIFDGSGAPLLSSAIGNPYLFRGMRFDGESGLYLDLAPCDVGQGDCDSASECRSYMFDPKIGASLQRESSHAVNAWSMDVKMEGQKARRAWYYTDPWAWTGTDGWVPIPIDP